MQSLNSDQLRKLLKKHTRKMNWLAEQNNLIVATLKQRGLQAVDPAGDDISIHPCIMQLDKLQSEPKPLTADELKVGGWWMNSATIEDRDAFICMGVPVDDEWEDANLMVVEWFQNKAYLSRSFRVVSNANKNKQIHRIGNNFYWGAASDQAN